MHIGFRNFDLGLLPVAAGTLGTGLLLFAFGAAVAARLAWAAGALVVTGALIVAIVQSLKGSGRRCPGAAGDRTSAGAW
jgi:hypothetical protein